MDIQLDFFFSGPDVAGAAAGRKMYDQLLADLEGARLRVALVAYLPPDRTICSALDRARSRLGEHAQVIVDGTTQSSVGRVAAPWWEVLVLPAGSIHAKCMVIDEIVWVGSWNFNRTSRNQPEAVCRTAGDSALVTTTLGWMAQIRASGAVADLMERPRGSYKGSPEQAKLKVDPILGF